MGTKYWRDLFRLEPGSGVLVQYAYFQLLDVLSTIAFLMMGVKEANPVVVFAFSMTGSAGTGLLAVKIVALALGYYAWKTGRVELLARVNALFGLLIAWNLVAIILSAAAKVQPV